MTLSLPLPDWVPWWGSLAILIAGSLFALMFLLMPFAVFGVKGRLDLLEARLDEIQGEIRSLSLRLPEPGLSDGSFPANKRRFPEPGGYAGPRGSGSPGEYTSPDGYAGSDGYARSDGNAGPDGYAGLRPPIPPAPRDRRSPAMPPRTEPRLY